jgi:hypothetical protein
MSLMGAKTGERRDTEREAATKTKDNYYWLDGCVLV